MPRAGEPTEVRTVYPWAEWNEMLLAAPNQTLYFSRDDFPTTTPDGFRYRAKVGFQGAGTRVRALVRGDEVMVTVDA